MRSNWAAAVVLALALVASGPQVAHAASLDGEWSGSGYVEPAEGKREQVRCKVRYTRQSSKVYGVVATCASTSAKIRQTGEVLMVTADRYVGDFYNPDFDVSGRIRIVISGTRQTVTFSGRAGQGSLSLSK